MSDERPIEEARNAMNQNNHKTPNSSNDGKGKTIFMVMGLLVILLLGVGVSLPPISLWERLGMTGTEQVDTPDTVATENNTSTNDNNNDPTDEPTSITTDISSNAVPDDLSLVSAITTDSNAIDIPSNITTYTTVDMYGWNGSEWVFVPSRLDLDNQQLVALNADPSLSSFALMQVVNMGQRDVAFETMPTQIVPTNLLPYITQMSVGVLTLVEGGELTGSANTVPNGGYQQWLRATNTGAVVDVASLGNLLNDGDAQAVHINDLVERANAGNYAGIHIDYQGVPDVQQANFTQFIADLATALHAQDKTLAVTLGTPLPTTSRSWDTAGHDWAMIGQYADLVFVQMPLDPTAYADNGDAEQLLTYAVRLLDRRKLALSVTANAIRSDGTSYVTLPNNLALANLGNLTLSSDSEVAPDTNIDVTLTASANPLQWDGTAVAYKYDYESNGNSYTVWIHNEATLNHQLRFAGKYNIKGFDVRGMSNLETANGYAATIQNQLGLGEAPNPPAASIVWTVTDSAGIIQAQQNGEALSYQWTAPNTEGNYIVNAEFIQGDAYATLGNVSITVAQLEVAIAPEENEDNSNTAIEGSTDNSEATDTTTDPSPSAPTTAPVGNATAAVNVGSNVRSGPGLSYPVLAGAEANTLLQLIGRDSGSSWFNVTLPDETEGWIYGPLITISDGFDTNNLAVVEVAPPPSPVVTTPRNGNSSSGGATSAPPPAPVGGSFELGGQTHTLAHPGEMLYAGMTWVKFQHKWSNGDTAEAVRGRIEHAHNNGLKVLLSIPGSDHNNINFGAYVEFLRSVATLGPDAIEIWNEMNIDREWPAGQISPQQYVNQMLKPAYEAIKGANSSVMVISGAPAPTGFFGGCSGSGCDDKPYIEAMAAAGAANYMDCIGIHYNEGIISPNQQSGDPRGNSGHYTRYYWGMVNTYYNAFGGSRPLCFTELGYLSGEGYGGLPAGFAWAENVTVAQQAQWLAEATSLSANSGKVRMLIVFNVDFTHFGADPQAGFGMIRPGGGCPACDTLHNVMQ